MIALALQLYCAATVVARTVVCAMMRLAGSWDLLERFMAGDFHVSAGSRCVVTVGVFFASRCCGAANFGIKFAGFASHVWLQLGMEWRAPRIRPGLDFGVRNH